MKGKWLLLFAAIAMLTGCTSDFDETITANGSLNGNTESEAYFVDGKVCVKLDADAAGSLSITRTRSGAVATGLTAIDEICARYGVVSMERVFTPDDCEERMHKFGLDRWYEIEFSNDSNTEALLSELASTSGITYAERIHRVRKHPYSVHYATEDELAEIAVNRARALTRSDSGDDAGTGLKGAIPDDPYLEEQWMLRNDGSIFPGAQEGADINVFPAWVRCTGNPNVIVAVVDEGVQYNHPDLAANIWPGIGKNFVRSSTGSDNVTGESHGTHVAGTIAAVSNNGIGIAGIAGGNGKPETGVKIMSCQIFEGDRGASSAATANAIKYAANNGAVICQNSWGNSAESMWDDESFFNKDKVVREAIDYFIKYAGTTNDGESQAEGSLMMGGLVVFAAGNEGGVQTSSGAITWNEHLEYPASYEPCISVGAMSCSFIPSWYSTFNDRVDLCAPGGGGWDYNTEYQMVATERYLYKGHNLSTLPTSIKNGDYDPDMYDGKVNYVLSTGYGWMSGTSMACPHVSGVAALIVSYCGGPGFTVDRLEEILVSTARDISEYDNLAKRKGKIGKLVDAGAAMDEGAPVDPVDPELNFGARESLLLNRIGARFEEDLYNWFFDANYDIVEYSARSNDNSIASATVNGRTLTVRAVGNGKTTVRISATDSRGASVSTNVEVTVNSTGLYVDLFPNPVVKTLYIVAIADDSSSSLNEQGRIIIRNSLGAEVYSGDIKLKSYSREDVENNIESIRDELGRINFAALNPGRYSVTIEGYYGSGASRNTVSATKTIVKQ